LLRMAAYFVETDDLIRELSSADQGSRGWPGIDVEQRVTICEPIVDQLVERFDLTGKTLMSVGPGTAHEEVALLRKGMRRAFLFDIDEKGIIEPALRRIGKAKKEDSPIVYFIGDFVTQRPSPNELESIDVLYFSGFTPDELRRVEISERHRQQTDPQSLSSRSQKAVTDPDWPEGVSPLHEVVLKAIDLYLADGGLFILQSFCAGFSLIRNPSYVNQWEQVLQHHRGGGNANASRSADWLSDLT
jgi:hypothetical protein